MNPKAFGDDVNRRGVGCQAFKRVLEDHLEVTAQSAQLAATDPGDIDPADRHRTGTGLLQAHDGSGHRGFSAAGLPYQRDDLALMDLQVDTVDCACGQPSVAAANREMHSQVTDFGNHGAALLGAHRLATSAAPTRWQAVRWLTEPATICSAGSSVLHLGTI